MENLKAVSADLIGASRKRRMIGKALSARGFLPIGKGAWLGLRGKDAVSGLLIEGSPSDTYVSSFLLPIFDELKFVSWSLGRRLVHCSAEKSAELESQEAVERYCADILPVRSAGDMIRYLDVQEIDGFYPLWVRYLCMLRDRNLNQAHEYMNEDIIGELHISTVEKLNKVSPSVTANEVAGVVSVLNQWEATSRLIFGNGDYVLDASSCA